MQKRTLKVALLAVLAILLVLGITTVALADTTWKDLPDTVTAKYSITDNQVAGISEGFAGGLWKPYQPVTRAQFVKMAVAAFNIPMTDPATASFTDVPKGSYYYQYVEGAKAAGIANGTSATVFGLNENITRQQAVAIVARYIAKTQGFNLATMYTADELAALLKHFGDAASISADLKTEVAFAYDMGLTNGDNYGNFNPLANVSRIQAAAFLIRAQGEVPPQLWVPAKIEQVSADKTEGLIGQQYKVTYQVTTAAGHPAIGVLVDFDTMFSSDFYVGNIEPQAAVTDNYGQVTVTMLSLEPGTQRISATVNGVGTIYTTRYWLALDEVYNTLGPAAQNNAGTNQTWGVRVVVFGPGPESTSLSDWYNAVNVTKPFNPTDIDVADGVDFGDYWNYGFEKHIGSFVERGTGSFDYKPRTLAGVSVLWSIYDLADNPKTALTNEAVTSVGNIISVDGASITPAKTAVGKTDANGLSTITVYSEASSPIAPTMKHAVTLTKAVADYDGNPYPKELFNHRTFEQNTWNHNYDWDDQPMGFPVPLNLDVDGDGDVDAAEAVPSSPDLFYTHHSQKYATSFYDADLDGDWDGTEALYSEATQVASWIPHTIGGTSTTNPISPAYQAANLGEEKTLTITLTDVYGNPVAGKGVEWRMQGVGFFQTDDSGDTSDPNVAANNVDYDTTDAAGKAQVFVKSYDSGEQVVHAKVRDKGTGGAEGTWVEYTAEVQWFDVDIVTFDDITTQWGWSTQYVDTRYWIYQNEALSANPVNTSHTFTLSVYGLKLEYDPSVDYADGQTPIIDTDATGSSYDGIFNSKDAKYLGGILMYPEWPSFYELRHLKDDATEAVWQAWFEAHWSQLWSWFDDKMIEPWGYKWRIPVGGGQYVYEGQQIPMGLLLHALPWDANGDGIIEKSAPIYGHNGHLLFNFDETGDIQLFVAGQWVTFSMEGAYTMYDYNDDGYPEDFAGVPGIYLPLANKDVTFTLANEDGAGLSNLASENILTALNSNGDPIYVSDFANGDIAAVGSITAPTTKVKTDAAGHATVTVTAQTKGPETVKATVDWAGNPHSGPQLVTAYAKKQWTAGTVAAASDVTIEIWIDGKKVATNKDGNLLDYAKAAWTVATKQSTNVFGYSYIPGDLLLSSAHVEVHVKDAYGNDLPDYEVVYLLENIDTWLGGSQNAAQTFIPFAFLVDKDTANYDLNPVFPDREYDSNGTRPDNDEPTPASDPYAYIVGPGGTPSFFFNQWLGSEKGTDEGNPGLASWYTRVAGMGFGGYHGDLDHVGYVYTWNRGMVAPEALEIFNGFDSVLEYTGPWPGTHVYAPQYQIGPRTFGGDVSLATDGAKAWTRDGYFMYDGSVIPNLLTGSNIDIQLADDPTQAPASIDWQSILRVMVYAPADGLTKEGSYIWSDQVSVTWVWPHPTTIKLAPATDYAIAGAENQTLVATVYDQFGNPMPGVPVLLSDKGVTDSAGLGFVDNQALEGSTSPALTLGQSLAAQITDAKGNAAFVWGQTAGAWGVERIYAYIDSSLYTYMDGKDHTGDTAGVLDMRDELYSTPSIIQWIYWDNHTPDLVDGSNTLQKITVYAGLSSWNGATLKFYLNPQGALVNSLGSMTYVSSQNCTFSTNLHTWVGGEAFFVNDSSSSNYDGVMNWVQDVVGN